jgi:type I restriction enzyme S subunit
MNETLEAMARAIFRDWFVDFGPTRARMEGRAPYLAPEIWSLFPDRLDADGKPEGWRMGCASEFIEFNPSESLKKGEVAPYIDMAALPTTGSVAQPPVLREFSSGTKFRDGDTLFARITPCLENGKTAFVQRLGDGVVGYGSTEFIVMRSKEPIPPAASYILARDDGFRAYAMQSMTGTSGRQRARMDAIKNYAVTLPADDALWIKLSEFLAHLFERIAVNAEETSTLTETRDFLLPKLMSGEIRVRDAEQIVEEIA